MGNGSGPPKISEILKVFLANQSAIKAFLRRYTSSRQDIEDITQETILRALQAEKTQEIYQPRGFLFGVAKNIARKELDRKSRKLIDFIEDLGGQEHVSSEPPIEDDVDARQRLKLFWEAVATLPPQCQRGFVLKKVYGLSHKEIASRLNISVSTVEKHVAAGLKRCSDHMEKRLNAPAAGELDVIQSVGGRSRR